MRQMDFNALLEQEVYLICEEDLTIRQVSERVNRCKSSVFLDVTKRLEKLDPISYSKVRNIFDEHKKIMHIRGGQATKEKYARIKSIKQNL